MLPRKSDYISSDLKPSLKPSLRQHFMNMVLIF